MARIAIIGAGISGLACALTLRRANLNVRLYEANPEAGGRIKEFAVGNSFLSLGAKTISSSYKRFMALIDEMGLSNRIVRSNETIGVFTRGRLITLRPLSILLDGTVSPRTKIGLIRLKNYLDKLSTDKFDHSLADISLEDFTTQRYPRGVLENFIQPFTRAFFGDAARSISAWSGLQVISGAFETYELEGGYYPLVRAIESSLSGSLVKGARIERVEVKPDGRFGLKFGGQEEEADLVVCCVPVPELVKLVDGISYPEVDYMSKMAFAIEGESRYPKVGQLVNGDPEYRTDVIHFRGRYATLSSTSEDPDLPAFFRSAKVLTLHRWPYCSPRAKPGAAQPSYETEIPNLYKSGDMIYGGGLEACTKSGQEVAELVMRRIAAE